MLQPQMISALLDAKHNINNIDDRKMLVSFHLCTSRLMTGKADFSSKLEHGLILLASTPPESEIYQKMQNAAVQLRTPLSITLHSIASDTPTTVYNDLTHPPSTYVSNKYAWRSADGSYNNVNIPEMGKAGNPYSRSVQMVHPLPGHMLPDAGLVFDTLLKREKVRASPAPFFFFTPQC